MNFTLSSSRAEFPIELSTVFSPEAVVSIPRHAGKLDVLDSLVRSLADCEQLPRESVESIVDALLERERYASTGLGKGLAFPHLRSRAVVDFAGAVGVARRGVDFNSLDRLPTYLIILILSPFDERERHSEIMGRLATLLSNKTLQYYVQLPRSPEALFHSLGF